MKKAPSGAFFFALASHQTQTTFHEFRRLALLLWRRTLLDGWFGHRPNHSDLSNPRPDLRSNLAFRRRCTIDHFEKIGRFKGFNALQNVPAKVADLEFLHWF